MAPPRRQPSDDSRGAPKRSGRTAPRRQDGTPAPARRRGGDAAGRPGGEGAPGSARRPPDRAGPGSKPAPARTGRRRGDSPAAERALPATWGNVARRGARVVKRRPEDGERPEDKARDRGRPPAWEPERWSSEPVTGRDQAAKAVDGPAARSRPRGRKVPKVITAEVASGVEPAMAAKVERRLAQAADAFERDHLPDALKILRPLSKDAPGVPAVRELTGLALYGTGQWAPAAKELEAFRTLTSSVEQHPVLADCYRALKRYPKVAELWEELREASPSAALVTEGRIVAAGALADQGDVKGAIRLLERGPVRPTGRTAIHHVRLWYALADLYERAGDAPRARDLFARVVAVEPGLADAAERLAALG